MCTVSCTERCVQLAVLKGASVFCSSSAHILTSLLLWYRVEENYWIKVPPTVDGSAGLITGVGNGDEVEGVDGVVGGVPLWDVHGLAHSLYTHL